MIPIFLPSSDDASVWRYVQPVAFGSLLIATPALARARRTAIVLAVIALPMWGMSAVLSVRERTEAVASLSAQIHDRAPLFSGDTVGRYRQLDSALPHGASVYAVLPLPSLLDYREHRVLNADLIGCASLPPGMPFFRGLGELKKYFRSAGIDYVAFNDFDHPSVDTGYWRRWWKETAASRNPVLGPMAPYTLDLMENLDRLAGTEEIVFHAGDLTAIRLR